ncbi:hypothetical protein FF38_13817 [Lucilia cuprina]|uniref:Uncharacterized protein n=1 Tax=Lucilia cuprina TaxID=7375 RepID=A0A0L0BX16_LUCCU|nr:hypothetical protein FF38_13817 [Lucilia cuprina]
MLGASSYIEKSGFYRSMHTHYAKILDLTNLLTEVEISCDSYNLIELLYSGIAAVDSLLICLSFLSAKRKQEKSYFQLASSLAHILSIWYTLKSSGRQLKPYKDLKFPFTSNLFQNFSIRRLPFEVRLSSISIVTTHSTHQLFYHSFLTPQLKLSITTNKQVN